MLATKGFGRCRTRGDFDDLVTNHVVGGEGNHPDFETSDMVGIYGFQYHLSLFCPELTGLTFAFEPSSKYTSKAVQNIPAHNVLLMSNVRSDS